MKAHFLLKLIHLFSLDFWLDLLFPIHCLSCRKERQASDHNRSGSGFLCKECFQKIYFNAHITTKAPLHQISSVKQILAASSYHHYLVAEIIKTMKFKSIAALAEILADLLIIYWQGRDLIYSQKLIINTINKNRTNIIVIPIPLSTRRYQHRGFNQAEIIARRFSAAFNYECLNMLIKTKDTKAQFSKSPRERLKTKTGIYKWLGPNLNNYQIILIDDVITSGATIYAACQALEKMGAQQIIVLAVASA